MPLPQEEDSPAVLRLARLVAQRIWYWTQSEEGADDPDCILQVQTQGQSRVRRMRPDDVLVLVRRRNEFIVELVRELKRLDVPVSGVDRMRLTEQLPVMDLVALGRALLLPEDNLNLAAVLKGPLIGLSEDQLFELAYDRGDASLWDRLRRFAQARDRDPAFRRAHEILSDLAGRADYVAPFDL